ncbi:hypothetical protein B2I21_00460, partial [Chryseobacterium mucoviscidosis]
TIPAGSAAGTVLVNSATAVSDQTDPIHDETSVAVLPSPVVPPPPVEPPPLVVPPPPVITPVFNLAITKIADRAETRAG